MNFEGQATFCCGLAGARKVRKVKRVRRVRKVGREVLPLHRVLSVPSQFALPFHSFAFLTLLTKAQEDFPQ
jgi:hypothetical protein